MASGGETSDSGAPGAGAEQFIVAPRQPGAIAADAMREVARSGKVLSLMGNPNQPEQLVVLLSKGAASDLRSRFPQF
jgi:hypothetical protein